MKLTYQQLEDLCGRQEKQIAQQAQRIKELEGLLKKAVDRIAVQLARVMGIGLGSASAADPLDGKRRT